MYSSSPAVIAPHCFLFPAYQMDENVYHNLWAQQHPTSSAAAEWKAGYYDETASHPYW